MCGFHLCLLSKSLQNMDTMIASLHICSSVHDDQLWLEFTYCSIAQVCQHFFVSPSGPRDFLFFQLAECCLKCQKLNSFIWSDVVWCRLSVFNPLCSCLGVPLWLSCNSQIVWYPPVCQSPYHHSLPRCCNSPIVLVIQLFDTSPKLLVNPCKVL